MAAKKEKKPAKSEFPKGNILAMIKSLEKDSGARQVELRPKDFGEGLSTCCLVLDLILGGRIYGGRITTFYGPPGSGKSSLAASTAGYLQRKGIPVVFDDFEGTSNDVDYLTKLGVDTSPSGLIMYRPEHGHEAYNRMLEILQGLPDQDYGLPPLCFFTDSIAMMPTRGEMEAWDDNHRMAQRASMHSEWMTRLRTLVSKKNVAWIAINQIRANPSPYAAPEALPGGNAWAFGNDNLIKIKKKKAIEVGGEQYQPMLFKTEKNKNYPANQEGEVYLHLGQGIDVASDVLGFLKLTGNLQKDKKLPMIVGMDEYADAKVDMTYRSAATLEGLIRQQKADGSNTLRRACEAYLASGKAIRAYEAKKRGGPIDGDEETSTDGEPEVEAEQPEQEA
jgi:RecA/RadA recombinase